MLIPGYDRLVKREASPSILAANLAIADERTASSEVQELYAQFRQAFGRPQVPGILQCFATHPTLLAHMMGLAKEMLFVDGALGRRNKELVSAFVSASNRCAYCADSHAYTFRTQGGGKDAAQAVLAGDINSEAIEPAQRVLLQFARKVNDASQEIAAADMDAMRAAGWNDLQIAEAIHVAALFASFNRVANAFGLPSQDLLQTYEQQETAHGR